MEAYKAAAIQMNSQPEVEANLEQAYRLVREAAEEGASLIGLPENFGFLGDLPARLEQAPEIADRVEAFLTDTAKEFEVLLLGGGYPVPASSGRVYNRSLLVGPEGLKIARYDKMHLFDVDLEGGESYRESDFVEAGNAEPVCAECGSLGIIGLSICYDLRFPELYRKLSELGADMMTVPSAFTQTTGAVHWKPLLRARAIENTAYVFAPAQTGLHGKNRRTYGHAMIVSPWGEVVADGGTGTGVVYAGIDPEMIDKARKSIPSLKHRRL